MSASTLRLISVLLPAALLLHAACGTTYTASGGGTGPRVLPDGAIVLSDGAVVLPGSDGGTAVGGDGGAAAGEIQPFVALGPSASCFLGASGAPRCEGLLFATYATGAEDELGNPITSNHQLELKTLTFPTNVRKVWISYGSICVLAGQSDLALHCAGSNESLQIGEGITDDATPFLPMHPIMGLENGVTDAMLGSDYGCAIKSGETRCWGSGITTPGAVPLPSPAVQLAGGSQSRCALTAAGDVYCWGYSVVPRAKPADPFSSSAVPVLMDTNGKVASVSMSPSGSHVCTVGVNGFVHCWGKSSSGQVGKEASTYLVDVPSTVDPVSPGAISAGAGAEHSCAIKANGSVSCWGNASRGALGDNLARTSTTYVHTPVSVDQLGSGASMLFVGDGSACALVGVGTSRSFKCWGANTLGKLQNGNATDQKTPASVPLPI